MEVRTTRNANYDVTVLWFEAPEFWESYGVMFVRVNPAVSRLCTDVPS